MCQNLWQCNGISWQINCGGILKVDSLQNTGFQATTMWISPYNSFPLLSIAWTWKPKLPHICRVRFSAVERVYGQHDTWLWYSVSSIWPSSAGKLTLPQIQLGIKIQEFFVLGSKTITSCCFSFNRFFLQQKSPNPSNPPPSKSWSTERQWLSTTSKETCKWSCHFARYQGWTKQRIREAKHWWDHGYERQMWLAGKGFNFAFCLIVSLCFS